MERALAGVGLFTGISLGWVPLLITNKRQTQCMFTLFYWSCTPIITWLNISFTSALLTKKKGNVCSRSYQPETPSPVLQGIKQFHFLAFIHFAVDHYRTMQTALLILWHDKRIVASVPVKVINGYWWCMGLYQRSLMRRWEQKVKAGTHYRIFKTFADL